MDAQVKTDKNNRLSVHEDNNYSLFSCMLIYTAIFAVMAFLVYFLFIVNGKTFLRYDSANKDAFAQRYMFIFEFKRFLSNLFSGGEINTWDWSIGLGADAYAFNVSQLFSPSGYIYYFTPDKYVDIAYTAVIVLRVYLSGAAFILFAKETGLTKYQAILGAVTYTFCPWIIKTTIYQGTFIKATMLFPLIILGEDRIIKRKSPLLFILTVGYTVLTVFSFAYMIALIVLLYFFVRMITAGRPRSVMDVVRTTAIFIFSGIAGILLSGAGLVVTLLKFGETTGATGMEVETLWSMTSYLRLPMRLMTWTSAFGSSSLIGVAAIGIVMIPLIAYRVFRRDTNAIMTVLLFIFVLIPDVNSMFNYFSYPTGRWMFMLLFFFSLSAASCFDRALLSDIRSKIAVTAVFGLYAVYMLWIQKILGKDIKLIVAVSCLTCVFIIAVIWVFFRKNAENTRGMKIAEVLVLGVMCVSVAFCYNVKFNSEYKLYLDIGQAEEVMDRARQRVAQDIDDDSFYRVDQANSGKNNEQMYFGNRSIYGFYSNIDVGWILYNKFLGNSQSYYKRVRMRSNDNRFGLDFLQGTKYFIGDKENADTGYNKYAGFGYEPYKTIDGVDVLRNRYNIGIGCMFDSFIRQTEWEKLSYADREAAMLMAVVVPDEDEMPSGMKEVKASDIKSGIEEAEYTMETDERHDMLAIHVKNDDEHQLLLYLGNVKVAGDDLFTINVDNGTIQKFVVNSRGDERGYPDMRDFTINLGSGKDAGQNVLIELDGDKDAMASGINYDDLIVYRIPLETYSRCADKLSEGKLELTRFDNDHLSGTVKADSTGVLYLSILDNYGWDVFVDGKKAEPRDHVDIAFTGVDIEPGEHKIELIYHTEGFWTGIIVSIAGIILTILILLFCRRFVNTGDEDTAGRTAEEQSAANA